MRRVGKRIGIAAIILHPSYDHASLTNDLALVRLMDLALFNKNVYPTCFWPKDQILENKEFHGFGVGPPSSESFNFDKKSAKNESFLFVLDSVDNMECNAAYLDKSNLISSNQICAGQKGTFLVPGWCEVIIQIFL